MGDFETAPDVLRVALIDEVGLASFVRFQIADDLREFGIFAAFIGG